MPLSRSILLITYFFLSGFCNAPENEIESFPYLLGATKIITQRISFCGRDSIELLQLHNNENTARNVAVNALKKTGGSLLSISNRGSRLVKFTYRKKVFEFDPNRIFTPLGRKETLQKNSQYTKASENIIAGFAAHLLQLINTVTVISMHNNTDGAYSINSYHSGGANAGDAAQVHVNNKRDADNFFLTTDPAIYESIKALDYNIVLQDNLMAADDGSLSIYCGRSGVPYINIEAQHGHEKEQSEMLEILLSLLKNEKFKTISK